MHGKHKFCFPEREVKELNYVRFPLDNHIMPGYPEIGSTRCYVFGDINRTGKEDLDMRVKGLCNQSPFPDFGEMEPALFYKVHDRCCNPALIGNCESYNRKRRSRTAFFPDGFYLFCHVPSECFKFATNYLLGNFGYVLKPVVYNPVDFTLDLLHFDSLSGQNLHTCHKRAVNGLSDLGEKTDIHFFNPVNLFQHSRSQSVLRAGCRSCRHD